MVGDAEAELRGDAPQEGALRDDLRVVAFPADLQGGARPDGLPEGVHRGDRREDVVRAGLQEDACRGGPRASPAGWKLPA